MFRSQGADRELLPEPFVDGGAERLNQIAGQGFAAKAGPVVKAEQRVEAGAVGGAYRVEVEQGVAERQARIDGVSGRAPVATRKAELWRKECFVSAKVGACGAAFEPAQSGALILPVVRLQLRECVGDAVAGIEQGLALVGAQIPSTSPARWWR